MALTWYRHFQKNGGLNQIYKFNLIIETSVDLCALLRMYCIICKLILPKILLRFETHEYASDGIFFY